ncbi:MAG: hypothetical protein ACE5J2_06910 [Nitrososphaerales archaeon]
MSVEQYLERTVKVEKREFYIRIIRMSNGCFISISEGPSQRIGSLNVSLHGSMGVNTAKVIPSKYDSIFLNMISERIASLVNGICIISLYTPSALDLNAMKKILESITDAIGGAHGST